MRSRGEEGGQLLYNEDKRKVAHTHTQLERAALVYKASHYLINTPPHPSVHLRTG